MRRWLVLGAAILSSTVAAQTPGPPINPAVVIGQDVGFCSAPVPNPTHFAWVSYDLGEWHEARPVNADDPAYCLAVGLGSGIPGLADGVLGLCEVRPLDAPDLVACRQAIIQATVPTWSLSPYPASDGTPAVGTVVVNPANGWQAKCVGCNVPMMVCTGGPTPICTDP